MFKWKKRYTPILLILLVFTIAFPSFSQEATAEPSQEPVPTEEVVVPTEETVLPTEEVIAPTEEILTPTEEAALPTEEVVAPTEELTPIVEATEEAVAETTVEAPLPTATPDTVVTRTPTGTAVEMLLQYNPSASESAIQALLLSLGATELERLPQIGVIRVMIPSSVSNLASAQANIQSNNLASTAGLTAIEPIIIYHVDYTPNDPLFGPYQTNFMDEANGGDPYSINMQTAWDVSTRDGQGVTVAVIDTGVDLQHPDLIGRTVAGWDFYTDDNNPDDEDGHGTHVAGVIGARTNNGIGVAGIAYNALILPVRVCGDYGCPSYDIAAGIVYAVDRGAKVINMSLGGPVPSTTILGAINYALSRNVTVVVAAGNEGDNYDDTGDPYGDPEPDYEASVEISYPAYFPGVISVAALNPNGTIAKFSNTNDGITVAAPGVTIPSTFPTDVYPYNYVVMNGTSMAAPHVAGLAALLIADGVANTPSQVRDALLCGARDLNNNGYDNSLGYGLINAATSMTWNGNSSNCQMSQPNDFIPAATVVTNPSSRIQPVNTSSVTESADDPATVCGQAPVQTLWYKFTPTAAGLYHISTIGSSYDTLLGVYTGQPSALTEIGCSDDSGFATSSDLAISLNKGVTYFIMIGTKGGEVTGVAQLNLNAPMPNTLQQENAVSLRFTGTWNRTARTGASGGYIISTTDNNAALSFLVRGNNLNLTRLVGPDQGNMEIWIDGVLTNLNNAGATTRSQVANINLGAGTGDWHLVIIRKAAGYLPISIDALQGTDNALPTAVVGASRANDRTLTLFRYATGFTWAVTNPATGFLNNDNTSSSNAGAFVEFRASGSAINIFRSTGGAVGSMDIYIDNEFYATVNNGALPAGISVPYTIANLPPRERVVRIVSSGTNFVFDGAQSPVQTILTTLTDERSSAIAYSGIWTREALSSAQAQAGTLSTATGDADAYFMFNGNHLCIGYRQNLGNSVIGIYIDDVLVANVNTSGTLLYKREWCTYDANINTLTDTVHRVRVNVVSGSNGASLDYVRPVRRTIFTSTMGYIAENNAGIIYNAGTWTSTSQRSSGGYSFQGGSARRANIGGTAPRLSFNINGTGFILYTSLSAVVNAAGWEVYVDGSLTPLDHTIQGTTNPYIDLLQFWNRFRPAAVGVIELPVGNHFIELRGIQIYTQVQVGPTTFVDVTNPFVDFDGIRVLP